jgi:hypothetical protein
LNFDVRLVIYSFLELPPISHEALGIVLSCHQAHDEIEFQACRQVSAYLSSVEENARAQLDAIVEIPTFPTNTIFSAMKDVTIILPFYLVHAISEQDALIREHVALPLLLLWQDTLKLIFRANKDFTVRLMPSPGFTISPEFLDYVPYHRAFSLCYDMECYLCSLMEIIGHEIQLVQHKRVAQIGDCQMPTPPIRTKRVILQYSRLHLQFPLFARRAAFIPRVPPASLSTVYPGYILASATSVWSARLAKALYSANVVRPVER